ncbi:SRR1-like protein [Glandiceps talaboti]
MASDGDGFTVVRRKKGKSKTKVTRLKNTELVTSAKHDRPSVEDVIDVENVKRRIDECRAEVELSDFYDSFKRTMQCALLSSNLGKTCQDQSVVTSAEKSLDSDKKYVKDCGDYDKESCELSTTTRRTAVDEFHLPSLHSGCNDIDTNENFHVIDIICYGLGNFSTCPIARYQLVFLTLLKTILQIPGKCYCYDPRSTSQENDILRKMGFVCIEDNEEGKRKITHPTLFYMVHCGKPLYNNVLWANWNEEQLKNLIIVGNSFDNYKTRLPSRILHQEVAYISRILPYVKEFPFDVDSSYSEVFSDTSVHMFPVERVSCVPSGFWTDHDEPTYENCHDVEIIMKDK